MCVSLLSQRTQSRAHVKLAGECVGPSLTHLSACDGKRWPAMRTLFPPRLTELHQEAAVSCEGTSECALWGDKEEKSSMALGKATSTLSTPSAGRMYITSGCYNIQHGVPSARQVGGAGAKALQSQALSKRPTRTVVPVSSNHEGMREWLLVLRFSASSNAR